MDRGTGGTATLVARPDDHALVADVRRGDDAAFEALYDRYLRRITAYVRGMVYDHGRAEDVTQEVFMAALRRMRETERPIAFKPWIYEIARNACIDQHRRSRRTTEVSYDADHALGSSDHLRLVTTEPTPDAALDTKQALDHLCGAFGGLSQSHHEILVLRELEGMSYREIGDRMSLSRPAVESTLFRARRRLTEEYEDLVSGRRCERVHAIIGAAAEGMLGARDRRRLARHVSYCQACRQHARRLGVPDIEPARGLGARLAGLLPIPAVLRLGRGGPGKAAPGSSSQASSTLAQWAAGASPVVEPVTAGWSKAAATVVTMAALGMGAGASSHSGAIAHLTARAGSHAASAGTPRRIRASEPRASFGSVRAPAVGSALGAAAASAGSMPVSDSPRRSERGEATLRASRQGLPGGVRSTVSAVTGGRTVELPEVPVRLHVQAPALPARGREQVTPTSGMPAAPSTPLGVSQAGVPVPNLTPPPSLPAPAPVGAAVAGTRSVGGRLLGG